MKRLKVPFIDLRAQYDTIKHDVQRVIQEVVYSCAFINGKYVKEFEDNFASFCKAKHCIGVGNGTDALYIALKVLDIGPEDEVITVANSFVATSEAVTQGGARVVFVDCDEVTYNIDPSKIEEKITPRTKAIIPVHLYGQPAEMDRIMDIAHRYNLKVVQDAAQAHGALYRRNPLSKFGDMMCYSFYPGKNLGAYGDAGAILTNDDELASKIRMYANHGRKDKYNHEFEGVNSRMDGIQGAILNVKLEYLDRWTEKRREIAGFYTDNLNYSVITPVESTNSYHVYHLYVVRAKNRDAVRAKLKDKGISTGIHYPIPLPLLNAYRHLGYCREDFPVASRLANEVLSLPIYPEMTDEQMKQVVRCMDEAVVEK